MMRFLHYYGKFQGLRGDLGGLPSWARGVLLIAALPGVALILLSILAFAVSILALLIVTVPLYRVLQWITGSGGAAPADRPPDQTPMPSAGRRHVDVTIIE